MNILHNLAQITGVGDDDEEDDMESIGEDADETKDRRKSRLDWSPNIWRVLSRMVENVVLGHDDVSKRASFLFFSFLSSIPGWCFF
jgi:hypothetical protein